VVIVTNNAVMFVSSGKSGTCMPYQQAVVYREAEFPQAG